MVENLKFSKFSLKPLKTCEFEKTWAFQPRKKILGQSIIKYNILFKWYFSKEANWSQATELAQSHLEPSPGI